MISSVASTQRKDPPAKPFYYMKRHWSFNELIGKGFSKRVFSVAPCIHSDTSRRNLSNQIAVLIVSTGNPEEEEAFKNEVEMLRLCAEIPRTAKLLQVPSDPENGFAHIVTKLCEEKDLELWAPNKLLSEKLYVLMDVTDTLIQIHAKRIAHLDIKPKNIGISKSISGRYEGIIVDFGCAEIVDFDYPAIRKGTPAYSPPFKAKLTPYQRDIFALGVTIYEICHSPSRPRAFFNDVRKELPVSDDPISLYLSETEQDNIDDVINKASLRPSLKELLSSMLVMKGESMCPLRYVKDSLRLILTEVSGDVDLIAEGYVRKAKSVHIDELKQMLLIRGKARRPTQTKKISSPVVFEKPRDPIFSPTDRGTVFQSNSLEITQRTEGGPNQDPDLESTRKWDSNNWPTYHIPLIQKRFPTMIPEPYEPGDTVDPPEASKTVPRAEPQ